MGIEVRALVISIFLGAALYFTYGVFSLPWIAVLPICLALVVCSVPVPLWFTRSRDWIFLTVILAFLGVAAASLLPTHDWLRSMIVDVGDASVLPAMRILFGVAGVVVTGLLFVCRRKPVLAIPFFSLFLVVLMSAYALTMSASPRAQIDVWTVHEEGAAAFIAGENPYRHEYTNIYSEELRPYLTPGGVTYSYLPGTFMWMAPWKALGLDTRYSQILTRLLTAVLLFLIARKVSGRRHFMTFAPALLFITFPLTTFFIVRSWNDDISMMCYALAAYGMVSRRPWMLFAASNFLLIHKQHAVFFVPLLIWFAWREWRDKWAWLKATCVAAVILAGYLIADWRNFLGSLYGLTFLKFPNIHSVFLERRDPFSLMNYLNLFAGFKSNWFFLVILTVMMIFVLRSQWRKPEAGALLRGMGAMCLAMFMFAPIAFANYYQFALGLIFIGFAATKLPATEKTWEPRANWWTIGFITSRSAILFNCAWLIIETKRLNDSFGSYFSFQEFIHFHTVFQLAMLVCDLIIAWLVLRRSEAGRTSKLALSFFVFGPLFVGPLWYASPALVLALCAWFLTWIYERMRLPVRGEALLVLLTGAIAGACFWIADRAGYEVGFQIVLSPTHALIIFLALLPLCTPRSPDRLRRFTVPFFAVSLFAALAVSTWAFFDFETHYYNPSWPLDARVALIALATVSLALSLRKRAA